jgi:phage replication-related protein YjqB (UPF0714/DUF867 family)
MVNVRILVSRYIRKLASIVLGTILLVFMNSLVWSGSAQADAFGCYQKIGNPPNCPNSSKPSIVGSTEGSNCVQGKNGDWHTTTPNVVGSNVIVLSIHGGNIEANTSQISEDLQTLYGWDRYDFSGHVSNQACRSLRTTLNSKCGVGDSYCVLHITSTNFNDSNAVNPVEMHPRTVSIHGCSSSSCSLHTICAGGRNSVTGMDQPIDFRNYVNTYKGLLSSLLPSELLTFAFDDQHNQSDNGATCAAHLVGDDEDNIVNQNSIGEGLQLEISSNIRNFLVNNSIEYDLLRGVVYGGVAHAVGELPVPLVTFNGSESYTVSGKTFIRYKLTVNNRSEYPSEIFAPAPNLPPCGSNSNSSRTWVSIYNATNNQYIYGFCALSSPQSLNSIWFAVEQGKSPPASVYVSLLDREADRNYRSNRVTIPNL